MTLDYPEVIQPILQKFQNESHTKVTLREQITSGMSGAFVWLVDCEGASDGVFILKIGLIHGSYEDEETRHDNASKLGAFSKKIPSIGEQYLVIATI